MEFGEIEEFKKDLKKLSKRFITLSDDLEIVKKVLMVGADERPPFSYRIDGLGIKTCIIKIKKIASRSLKGRGADSGLRIVVRLPSEIRNRKSTIHNRIIAWRFACANCQRVVGVL